MFVKCCEETTFKWNNKRKKVLLLVKIFHFVTLELYPLFKEKNWIKIVKSWKTFFFYSR